MSWVCSIDTVQNLDMMFRGIMDTLRVMFGWIVVSFLNFLIMGVQIDGCFMDNIAVRIISCLIKQFVTLVMVLAAWYHGPWFLSQIGLFAMNLVVWVFGIPVWVFNLALEIVHVDVMCERRSKHAVQYHTDVTLLCHNHQERTIRDGIACQASVRAVASTKDANLTWWCFKDIAGLLASPIARFLANYGGILAIIASMVVVVWIQFPTKISWCWSGVMSTLKWVKKKLVGLAGSRFSDHVEKQPKESFARVCVKNITTGCNPL